MPASSLPPQRLADHADYRITLHRAGPRPSPRLVITFGGQPSDLADEGFGTAFCLSNGDDTVYVAQRNGTQYQGLSFETFRDVLAPLCAGRDVVTYGSSLGAYAALYYGGAVDARILAAAPMLPAWRPLANRVYADVPLLHREMRDNPVSSHAPVVLYDPHVPSDVKLVAGMVRPAYPALRAVEVPYGGHTVLVTLMQARKLKPFVMGVLDHDSTAGFTPPAEGTAIFHGERGRHLIARDKAAACAELRACLRLAPLKRYYNILVNLLIRMGNLAEAQAEIDAARPEPRLGLLPAVRAMAEAQGLRTG